MTQKSISIQHIVSDYAKGNISKPAFIEKMHVFHEVLFDYAEYIQHTDIKKIEIVDQKVLMTTRRNNLKMYVDPSDRRSGPLELLNFQQPYESDYMQLLQKCVAIIGKQSTVFDIGAHIGLFSMMLSKLANQTTIHAFEPIPSSYETLVKHLALNHLNRITPWNVGLSDKSGEMIFYFDAASSTNASLRNVSNSSAAIQLKADVTTMDAFTSLHHVYPDIIKCDVEGAELFVFKGAIHILAKQKPLILVEMLRKWTAPFGYHPNETIAFFANLGYQCYILRNQKLLPFTVMTDETIDTNFFFLHEKKHAPVLQSLSAV